MPTNLEVAGQNFVAAEEQLARARIARDRAIIAAHKGGAGTRAIGRQVGLDHSRVIRIIREGGPTDMDALRAAMRGSRLEMAEYLAQQRRAVRDLRGPHPTRRRLDGS